MAAARLGKSVALLSLNNHLGGMTASGLGVTDIGPVGAAGADFLSESRVNREWAFGPTARFRLPLRRDLLEFYLDDLLMQCYSLPGAATGRLGVFGDGTGLAAWKAAR